MRTANAVINRASITIDQGVALDVQLYLGVGGAQLGDAMSFGGWPLYLERTSRHHDVMSVAGHHMFRIMEIAGVESWEDLEGKCIRIETDGRKIDGIGHIVREEWYRPLLEWPDRKGEE